MSVTPTPDSEHRAALTPAEARNELGLRLVAYTQAAADPTVDRGTLAVVELEVEAARQRLAVIAANQPPRTAA